MEMGEISVFAKQSASVRPKKSPFEKNGAHIANYQALATHQNVTDNRGEHVTSLSLDKQGNNDGSPSASDDQTEIINGDFENIQDKKICGETSCCRGWCRAAVNTVAQQWKVLLLGQILAASLTVGSSFNDVLVHKCNLGDAPAFQMMWMYLVLGLFFGLGPCLPRQWGCGSKLEDRSNAEDEINALDKETSDKETPTYLDTLNDDTTPAWKWKLYVLAVAFFDVEGNYLVVKAFQYTSFKSIAILDCLAIPTTMLTSKFLLKRKYTYQHIVGSVICVLGACLTVFSDYNHVSNISADEKENDNDDKQGLSSSAWRAAFGDILAIMGALIYGISDTLAEMTVKHVGQVEYLSNLGFYGTLISVIQVLALERQHLPHYFGHSSGTGEDDGIDPVSCPAFVSWGVLSMFVIINALSYAGVAKFLIIADATLFNLSMLAGDAWAVILSIVIEQTVPTSLFYVSVVVLISGVIVYENATSEVVNAENCSKTGDSLQNRSTDNGLRPII
jgi:solute carrier family 35 protein F1/2